jgi:hypothetical protein
MHVENDLVGIVTVDDWEYEEIVEGYEKEILMSKGVPEPPVTNSISDTALAQGKPRCITLILIIAVYLYVVHLCCRNCMKPHAYIYLPVSLTRAGSSSALLRFIGSVSNLPLFTTGDYYYY